MLMLPGDIFQFTLFWQSLERNLNGSGFGRHDFQCGDIVIIIESTVFDIAKNHNQYVLFMCNGQYHQIEFFTPLGVKHDVLTHRTKKLNNNDKL